jgi:acetyl esterase/lipase
LEIMLREAANLQLRRSPTPYIVLARALKLVAKGKPWKLPLWFLVSIAASQGLWTVARHIWHLVHSLYITGTKHFLWAVPLQMWHLSSTFVNVSWRRLWGAPRSTRWSFFVELFVEGTRPRQEFVRNWDGCITPCIHLLTLIDYYGELVAHIFHRGVHIEHVTQGCPRPLTWVWYDDSDELRDAPELVILFLHGGGHWAFTGRSHLEYVARIVRHLRRAGMRVKACVVDTRRAPTHPWPAPLEDAMACYDWLQQGAGYSNSQIVLAGDSAGGGLCLAHLLALRDTKKPLPLCATVVSPFTDFSRTEQQYPGQETLKTDFLVPMAATFSGKYYTQGKDPQNPLISPKYGKLHALPPILIQAGQSELLARDSVEYARRLEAYGGRVKLEMYPEMPHIFPMLAPLGLRDAHTAISRQAKFVKRIHREPVETHSKHRLSIVVHDGRTQSFEDLRTSLGKRPPLISASSSPVLASVSTRELIRETLFPPEIA